MKTVDRILDASLTLLNEQGAALVTTNAIADAADLSVGNLYYHFKNKDDILLALYKQFLNSVDELIDLPANQVTLEGWAWWWHEWFSEVKRFSFLFHDQSYLLHRNEHLRFQYHKTMNQVEAVQLAIFEAMKKRGDLVATDGDLNRIAQEVTFIAFCWQDFVDLRQAQNRRSKDPYHSGLQQTLGLLLPYLMSEGQMQVELLMQSQAFQR